MNRRAFIGAVMRGLAASTLPWTALWSGPAAGAVFDPDRLFAGEELSYGISFWWFERIGTISLSFQRLKGDQGYVAQAVGQTHGVIALITRFRRDRYRAFMTLDPQMGLLKPHRFEEEVQVGRELFRAVRLFDHQAQEIHYLRPKSDGRVEERVDKMPAPQTADYLTAFYNLRAGVYGPPSHGRVYIVPTIPNQGNKEIVVSFLSRAETERKRQREKEKNSFPYYIDVLLDPKLLRSEKGQIQGWLSGDLIPQKGVIGRVIFFGDIKGWLEARRRLPEESDVGPLVPVNIREPSRRRADL